MQNEEELELLREAAPAKQAFARFTKLLLSVGKSRPFNRLLMSNEHRLRSAAAAVKQVKSHSHKPAPACAFAHLSHGFFCQNSCSGWRYTLHMDPFFVLPPDLATFKNPSRKAQCQDFVPGVNVNCVLRRSTRAIFALLTRWMWSTGGGRSLRARNNRSKRQDKAQKGCSHDVRRATTAATVATATGQLCPPCRCPRGPLAHETPPLPSSPKTSPPTPAAPCPPPPDLRYASRHPLTPLLSLSDAR